MTIVEIIKDLVDAGRSENFSAVAVIPGAGVHALVTRFSDALRGDTLLHVEALSMSDRAAFAKALAAYENTVGGIGSVTGLQRVLPLIQDDDHAALDWILCATQSYRYYSNGATSFADLLAIEAAQSARRTLSEQQEADRECLAKASKAQQASVKLFNAIRRGDTLAVEALLRHGANPESVCPDGTSYIRFAENLNRATIVELLHHAQSRSSPA